MNATSLASCRTPLRVFCTQFRIILLSCFWGGFILLLPQIASAATYTVTNTLDSGAGSLRDAINQVNAGAGGDTINFSGVTGTITLGSEIQILETVTINGPGANILAISGGDAVRIFQLGTGAANSAISGLTITHGNPNNEALSKGQGGAIQTNAQLTINNCTFSYNTAGVGSLNVGGALFGGAQAVTVNGSTFFNNKAVVGDGGAIFAGNLVVNNSTFYNNSAALEGGAIWVNLGNHLTINNSTIVGNTALSTTPGQQGGGGVWIGGNAPIITNSIISGNTAAASLTCVALSPAHLLQRAI